MIKTNEYEWQEFRFVGKKAILVWKIRQINDKYESSYGQLNGKMQLSSDIPGDKGVLGTQSYIDAITNCSWNIQREIRKKTEAGYIRFLNGVAQDKVIDSFSFNEFLPKQFTAYKPQTDIKSAALEKICAAGKARFTRKMDGFCCVAVYHTFGWQIYSRRMDLMTGHFPNHVAELENSSYKPGTMLVGEMVCVKDGVDDFKATSRVCRSLEEESRELVLSGEVVEPKYIIFDIIFHNGEDLKEKSYDERKDLWKDEFTSLAKSKDNIVCSVDFFQLTADNWDAEAKKRKWEGFVVTDGSFKPQDKFYSFSGKPPRPKGHSKLKPLYEDDVIVYAGLRGSGKRIDTIGSVFIKQFHPETGLIFDCGKVGSGFDEESLAELELLMVKYKLPIIDDNKDMKNLDLNAHVGFSINIEYSERQPGTNKFKFPVFIRTRLDKDPSECIAQKLAEDE